MQLARVRFGREERVFGGALAVVAVHALLAGSGGAAPAVLVLAPAAFALFVGRGRVTRIALAALIGLGAFAEGAVLHVARVIVDAPRAADVTGVACALAGLALIVLAVALATAGRGWRARVLTAVVGLAVAQWVLVPLITAALVVNAPRDRVAAARVLGIPGARDVTFPARDGVRLAGWYAPGRNGAAVVLLHGAHGDRAGTRPYLGFLARAGYAILAYDARGHGASAGQTNAYGWRGDADLAGAVRYLAHRPGIDPGRISALGLSMGGEEALRAAAGGVPLAAVVADGAAASTGGDRELADPGAPARAVTWVAMRAVERFSGDDEPPSLRGIVARIDAPVLLVASNRRHELEIDRELRARIGRGAALWHVADAGHTRAHARHPRAYEARVLAVLRRT